MRKIPEKSDKVCSEKYLNEWILKTVLLRSWKDSVL